MGIIIIRNFLSDSEQKMVAEGVSQRGTSAPPQLGNQILTSYENMHDTIHNFHKWAVSRACRSCLISRKVDPTIPKMNNKNMLLNMYKISPSGHVFQRNICEIDDEVNYPVSNVCVGTTCRIRVVSKGGVRREILLKSGDVLLYKGEKDRIQHSLVEVHSDDYPLW